MTSRTSAARCARCRNSGSSGSADPTRRPGSNRASGMPRARWRRCCRRASARARAPSGRRSPRKSGCARSSITWRVRCPRRRMPRAAQRRRANAGRRCPRSPRAGKRSWSRGAMPRCTPCRIPVRPDEHAARIEQGEESRHEWLLELEMLLKLDSPPALQAQRLALQVKQLKERFSSAAASGARTPADLLLAWCAQPGVADGSGPAAVRARLLGDGAAALNFRRRRRELALLLARLDAARLHRVRPLAVRSGARPRGTVGGTCHQRGGLAAPRSRRPARRRDRSPPASRPSRQT